MRMLSYVMVANFKKLDGREPIFDSREYLYYGGAPRGTPTDTWGRRRAATDKHPRKPLDQIFPA